ncbi:MAG: DUF1269 domain-containing protein [Chloroflexaceae bacterium]|nr:DUF1269 domain-containing protein [Chloroflexaceae bacterium]
MATLTVFKFPTPEGAEQTLSKLQDLQKQQLITILDAAVVTWPANKKKPRTRQLYDLTGAGALTGAFWGMLFGLIFLMPFMGALIGAAAGAISGSFADVGIDDNFIKEVREKVVPGTSALFLMSANAVVDRIRSELGALDAELIASNLSTEQEAKLRELFSEE